jgi:hypothetical protein
MSETKMSGEPTSDELFEAWFATADDTRRRHARSAWDAGYAAAIAERGELLDALCEGFREDDSEWLDNYTRYTPEARKRIDLLVKHGRVIRDGDGYRWKTKGDGK